MNSWVLQKYGSSQKAFLELLFVSKGTTTGSWSGHFPTLWAAHHIRADYLIRRARQQQSLPSASRSVSTSL